MRSERFRRSTSCIRPVPRVTPVRPCQGTSIWLCCTSCLLCQNEAFGLDWKGRNWERRDYCSCPSQGHGERVYIKACLFVFMVIAFDSLPLYPSEKTLPQSLPTSGSSSSIPVHQRKLYFPLCSSAEALLPS